MHHTILSQFQIVALKGLTANTELKESKYRHYIQQVINCLLTSLFLELCGISLSLFKSTVGFIQPYVVGPSGASLQTCHVCREALC